MEHLLLAATPTLPVLPAQLPPPQTAASPAMQPQPAPQQYIQQQPQPTMMQQQPQQQQQYVQGGVPQAYQGVRVMQPVQMVQPGQAIDSTAGQIQDAGAMGMGQQGSEYAGGGPTGGMVHEGVMGAGSTFVPAQQDPSQQHYGIQHQPGGGPESIEGGALPPTFGAEGEARS